MKKLYSLFFLALFVIGLQGVKAQNVGIGEAAPSSKLSVNGGVSVGSTYSNTATAPAGSIYLENSIAVGTAAPQSNAIAQFNSTSKGVIMPRMTAVQRTAIPTMAAADRALMVYDTDSAMYFYWDGAQWVAMHPNATQVDSLWAKVGNNIYNKNSANVGVGLPVPLAKLHIKASNATDNIATFENNAGTTSLGIGSANEILINGSAGTNGYVVTTQGAGLPPRWASATEGQQFFTVFSTGGVALTPPSPITLIPGLSQTITVPSTGTYDVYIYTDGAAQLTSGGLNSGAQLAILIYVDGAMQRAITSIIDNTSNFTAGIRSFMSSFYTTLTPGPHTIEIMCKNMAGNNLTVGTAYAANQFLVCSLSVGLIKR